jgi:nucleotide-binding universal stress UspA family protein
MDKYWTALPTIEAIGFGGLDESIREYIDETNIDFVVLRTYGRTCINYTLLGSTMERIARTVDVPVVTVALGDRAKHAVGSVA